MNIYLCGKAVYILSNLYLAKENVMVLRFTCYARVLQVYLWKFIIYTGADTVYPSPGVVLPKPFDEYGNSSKVVLSLLHGLYNKGYKVMLDNLYTSPDLLRALVQNETDGFGILRSKKGLPSDFWKWNPQKRIRYSTNEQIL